MDIVNSEVARTQFNPDEHPHRQVEWGPNGAVYLLTNAEGDAVGAVWRLEPM